MNTNKLFAEGRRFCYFIPVDAHVEGHGFRPSVVFENVKGHFPNGDWPYEGKADQKMPWFWGHTFEEAQEAANAMNEKLGLNELEVFKIVTSSMARQKPA